MSELQRKRSGFRFHLLTALSVTIVAGGVIGLNLSPIETVTIGGSGVPTTPEMVLEFDKIEQRLNNWVGCCRLRRFGWPQECFCTADVVRPVPNGWMHDPRYEQSLEQVRHGDDITEEYARRKHGLMIDVAVLVALVAGTAVLTEYIVRRRCRADALVPILQAQ